MKTKQVDHYGVHLSPNGLWFLIQDDEQNERALPNVKSNISVKTYRRQPPTHSIRLGVGELSADNRATLEWLRNDKLGKLLLPSPDNAGRVAFVQEDSWYIQTVHDAMWLTSPTHMPIRPSWMMTMAEARAQSRLTNVQPFIITDVTAKWMTDYGSKVIALFRLGTRPLILIGSSDVVLPREIKTRMKMTAFRKMKSISAEQLQNIGSVHLKDWIANARR